MKQRVALWDNIKFLLIVLVVVGHFIQEFTKQSIVYKSLFLFIYSFHMPLFIFISAIFHKNKNILHKFLFYISAGFALKFFITLTNRLLGDVQPSFSLLSDGSIPWFMFVLAIYTVLCYILRNQNKKYILISSVILACFVGYDQNINANLYLSRTIIFFPFYFIGTTISSDKILEYRKKYYKLILPISLFIVLIWAGICLIHVRKVYKLRYLFTGQNPFWDDIIVYGPLLRLLCYAITAILCIAIIIIVPSIKLPFITVMGTRSIDVYFWHKPIIIIMIARFYPYVANIVKSGMVGKLAYLVLPVILTVILSSGGIFSLPLKKIKQWCFNTPSK
jgi:fucose 4-O-acetylase-like acetyltransferase